MPMPTMSTLCEDFLMYSVCRKTILITLFPAFFMFKMPFFMQNMYIQQIVHNEYSSLFFNKNVENSVSKVENFTILHRFNSIM